MERTGVGVVTGGLGGSSNVWAPGSAGDRGQVRTDKDHVLSLLKQLSDATDKNAPKPQTEQNVRNQLNELRSKLGEDEYKKIIEQIKKDITESWLQLLMRLFPELFPDNPAPHAPAVIPGGGGGGGGGVNRQDFGPSTSVSNKPLTKGADYYNYIPDQSNPGKKPGKKSEPGNIWSGFSQGADGNCVTVSAIKAAMMQFGSKPTDVYRSVKETSKGYEVVMRDSNQVYTLTKAELKQAAAQARFKGDDPAMITSANFMYAMSAKRAQIERNDGISGRDYGEALRSLNDGEVSREGLDRLGLKYNYRPAFASDFANNMVGTVEYGGHSMAVIDNQIELWGRRGGQPQEGIRTVLFS